MPGSIPPLQTWVAGLVSLTGARDSWFYMIVAQVVTFIGLGYLVLTARKFIGREAEVPLAILFCGSIYYSFTIPTMALNADHLQIPLWAAPSITPCRRRATTAGAIGSCAAC